MTIQMILQKGCINNLTNYSVKNNTDIRELYTACAISFIGIIMIVIMIILPHTGYQIGIHAGQKQCIHIIAIFLGL